MSKAKDLNVVRGVDPMITFKLTVTGQQLSLIGKALRCKIHDDATQDVAGELAYNIQLMAEKQVTNYLGFLRQTIENMEKELEI
jgi:hypothetical protein